MGDTEQAVTARIGARRELFLLARLIVRKSTGPEDLARLLGALHPDAAALLPGPELVALAAMATGSHPSWARARGSVRAGGPALILDAMPPREARAVRRAGIHTDLDVVAKRCVELMARRGIGRKTTRAVLGACVAMRRSLACGCGWSGAGLELCARARRHGLGV